MLDRCIGTNKDGGPCSAAPAPGRSYCLWHDPERAQERAGWRQQGGKSRSNKARARKQLPAESLTLPEVQALLSVALKSVLAGRIEPGVANASASVARAIAALVQVGEMEARISALEEAAERSDRRPA
ncbi:MAG: hypothetical protein M3Q71_23750 [Chloroflexota bacterium]|nr:hypothetical protein [Chloroflexota bacterium]